MKAVLALIVMIAVAVILAMPFADQIFDGIIEQFDLQEDEENTEE